MAWARRYALRNIPFSITHDASTYGGGTYGGDFTYGQEMSDPLSNVQYVLVPNPGQWPSSGGWEYRVDDEGVEFNAVVLGINGVLDLSPVASAYLVLQRSSVGPPIWEGRELTINEGDNTLTCEFGPLDLNHQGVYRALVQLVFDSGRCMTVTADDSSTVIVRGGVG